jgi:hypothetical protein
MPAEQRHAAQRQGEAAEFQKAGQGPDQVEDGGGPLNVLGGNPSRELPVPGRAYIGNQRSTDMAKRKKSAFSDAQATVMKAFHDLERAVMGMMSSPAPKKAKARKAKKKAAKKKTKTRAR